jgi:hypothetical protein
MLQRCGVGTVQLITAPFFSKLQIEIITIVKEQAGAAPLGHPHPPTDTR